MNTFFCKDMKTRPFHGQILAVSEIMVKRKLRKLKTETLRMSSENGREEILLKVYLKEWQEEDYVIKRSRKKKMN